MLLRTGLRILGKMEDAEDAVQTTFLKLYRGIGGFRFRAKFSTYLIRIMLNVCFDILRKQKRFNNQSLENVDKAYTPDIDLQMDLEEAIASLPAQMRACFVLFAVEELKQKDIADIMKLSIGAVKAHIFQAKRRLRVLLSKSRTEV